MKTRISLYIVFSILVIVIIGCSNNVIGTKNSSTAITETPQDKSEIKEENVKPNSKYEIIFTLSNKRFDKGLNLYVLLDPTTIESTSLKAEIKLIINELVKEKGEKTSIDFYDNKETLMLDYKLYGDLSLGRNTTKKENENLALHHIAGFSGSLSTDLYENTLYMFPNADSSNPNVGKQVSIEEYNPDI